MLLPSVIPILTASFDYRYFLAGGSASALSHTLSVPFDVVKTRIQLNSIKKEDGFIATFKEILDTEGIGAFSKGLKETLIGYTSHGALKYGFYHEFKPFMMQVMDADPSQGSNIMAFILAGAVAEIMSSVALTPFEALRVGAVRDKRIGSQQPNEAAGAIAFTSLYASFPALLARQIPFTIVQLPSFDFLSEYFYSTLQSMNIETVSPPIRFTIAFFTSIMAGSLATIASQPGDTVLCSTNKNLKAGAPTPNIGSIVQQIYETAGPQGFFIGFQARMAHVNAVVVIQLLLYDFLNRTFF